MCVCVWVLPLILLVRPFLPLCQNLASFNRFSMTVLCMRVYWCMCAYFVSLYIHLQKKKLNRMVAKVFKHQVGCSVHEPPYIFHNSALMWFCWIQLMCMNMRICMPVPLSVWVSLSLCVYTFGCAIVSNSFSSLATQIFRMCTSKIHKFAYHIVITNMCSNDKRPSSIYVNESNFSSFSNWSFLFVFFFLSHSLSCTLFFALFLVYFSSYILESFTFWSCWCCYFVCNEMIATTESYEWLHHLHYVLYSDDFQDSNEAVLNSILSWCCA